MVSGIFKRLIPIILAFTLFQPAFSQDGKFRSDSTGFIEDLEKFMGNNKHTEDQGEATVERLKLLWETGKTDDSLRNLIYKVANTLEERRARAFPHFNDWLNTTSSYIEKEDVGKNFYEYQKTIVNLCNKRSVRLRHIQQFMGTVRQLIEHNHISQNGSTIWSIDTKKHTFEFNGDTLRIIFPIGTLTCNSVRDSIKIHHTEGEYDPVERIWYGKSGTTYWERAGYNKDSVFAIYDDYKIDMKLPNFQVDKARFYNLFFYEEPLIGLLTDKVTEIPSPKKAYYPQFNSYNNNFSIDSIFQDINYTGGFSMRGSKLYGSGNDSVNARIDIYRDVQVVKNNDTVIENILFLKALSNIFVFTDKDILSRNAKVVMTLNADSLYHPGLQFRYLDTKKEVTLLRDTKSPNMSRSPYYDSYHKFEIDARVVKWRVGDNQLFFTSLSNTSINNAGFQSYNLFNKKNFDVFEGFDFQHPFFRIRRYLNKKDTRIYTAKEIARVLNQPEHEARKILLHMTYLGFTDYDNNTHTGKMKQKFYDYLLNVIGEKDYDLINITSTTQGDRENAILNLRNFDIYVHGVPQIHISDAKRVNIFPKAEEIVLKENRSIDFAGVIETGYYTFFGKNFHFDYEKFGVDLEYIDSLQIKVVDYMDNYGKPVFKKVQSTIENITGNVLIDDPGNKSGIKQNDEYPIFKSTKDSYVYYDRSSIADGVYTRDTFYFRIDPYEIDSLNSFDAEGMKYTGTFYSGRIFPPIDEELQLKEDNSLGFNYLTPKDGLPVYEGKGHFYDSLAMSNEGLKGDGKLEFLTSTSWSDEFKFYPDTMRTLANRYINQKQENPYQVPKIEAQAVDILWKHKNDNMNTATTDKPAKMYEGQGEFKGDFALTPEGMTGSGHFYVEKGHFKSQEYRFLADQVSANVTDFSIKGMDEEALAFNADSIKTTVDFPSRTARFESLSSLKPMHFPVNEFKAFINTFEWAIDRNAMALKGNSVHRYENGQHTLMATPDKRHPRGNLFVAINPLQHELNYISPKTDVNLNKGLIESHDVQLIEIADATIKPGDGDFTIKPKSKYKTMVDAEIVANNTTKHHEFYEATVNIVNRKQYSASGYYDYIDKNKKPHKIRFDIIGVDSAENTYARGKILGEDDFTLSPAFDYRGEIFLYAQEKHLKYDGFFQATKNCDQYEKRWVKFTETLDPEQIRIPIDTTTVDINDNRVYKGIMLEHDSIHILPRFFTPRHHYTNYYVSTAKGVLQYNETGKKYEIASVEKLENRDTTLNYISMNTENCNLYGSGNISFTGDYGQVKFNNLGDVTYSADNGEVLMTLFSTVDFFFNEPCLEYMADTIRNFPGLKPVNMLSDRYRKGLANLVGQNKADQLLNEQKLFGAYKEFPKELEHTMVLSNATYKWVQRDGTFHSFGDIAITSINDKQVNKYVGGYIQTGTSRTGDYFTIYIEVSPTYWFFFKYKRGIMMAVSSDPAFNQIISDLKARHRRQDVERGEPKFYYHLGSKKDKQRWLDTFLEAEKEPEIPEETPDEEEQQPKIQNGDKATKEEEKPKENENENPDKK